jgi:adenylate cyclase class 2
MKMDEIEVKVIDVDTENVKTKIIGLGGKLVKNEFQYNYIYELPPHIENRDGYIRIRRIHDLNNDTYKNILCIKKIISRAESKITEEHETPIDNLEEGLSFLNAMEIKRFGCFNKHRESYKLGDVLVEIDTWDKEHFPFPYIEIEAESSEKIYAALTLLEIPHDKASSKSLTEIKKEMGIQDTMGIG